MRILQALGIVIHVATTEMQNNHVFENKKIIQ